MSEWTHVMVHTFAPFKRRAAVRRTAPKASRAAHLRTSSVSSAGLTEWMDARLCRALLVGCAPARAEGAMK